MSKALLCLFFASLFLTLPIRAAGKDQNEEVKLHPYIEKAQGIAASLHESQATSGISLQGALGGFDPQRLEQSIQNSLDQLDLDNLGRKADDLIEGMDPYRLKFSAPSVTISSDPPAHHLFRKTSLFKKFTLLILLGSALVQLWFIIRLIFPAK